MDKEIDIDDCILVLLIQEPNEPVRQILATQEQLRSFVMELPDIKILETPIQGLSLSVRNKVGRPNLDPKDIN